MRAFLRRCGQALVLGSICVSMAVCVLSFALGVLGGLLNEASNALALLANHIQNTAARKRRSE